MRWLVLAASFSLACSSQTTAPICAIGSMPCAGGCCALCIDDFDCPRDTACCDGLCRSACPAGDGNQSGDVGLGDGGADGDGAGGAGDGGAPGDAGDGGALGDAGGDGGTGDGGCTPECVGKECGDDGCSGVCGTCGAEEQCESDLCVCHETNDGVEICDELDNDCDGEADEDELQQRCYTVSRCCVLVGGACGNEIPGSSCWCCENGDGACCDYLDCQNVPFTCN